MLIHAPAYLPVLPPEPFLGRGALLEQLNQTLAPERAVQLSGATGHGSHALAAIIAQRYLTIGGKVLWATEGTPDDWLVALRAGYQAPESDLATLLAQHAPLIVLDGIPAAVAAPFVSVQLAGRAPLIHLTPQREAGPWANLTVPPLDQAASTALLQAVAPSITTEEATALAEKLGGNPIWLRFAGAQIASGATSAGQLLALLAAVSASTEHLAKRLATEAFRPLERREQGLLTVFRASFTRRPRLRLSAALLGQSLGSLPNEPLHCVAPWW
ncbi:MAG: hypothetical protein HC915_21590 [Anaerolineae bacterium]|nr:hypothetical protein [Anaerolineae bacterium]